MARDLHGLSTSYPQDKDLDICDDVFDDMDDLMDVPDFFKGSSPMERAPRMPQNQRSPTDPYVRTRRLPKIKPGVNLVGLKEPMYPVLELIRQRGDTVTSGLEGEHSPGSLHYDGLAVDVRFAKDRTDQIASYKRELPEDYSILAEASHLHISYDPEGRRV